MTQDPFNPLEPNPSNSQPPDSQPTNSQPTNSQPTNAEASEPSSAPNPTPEPIEPSSPLEGVPDLQPDNLQSEAPEAANPEPIESVAMTDATQHSTTNEGAEPSGKPPATATRSGSPASPSDQQPTSPSTGSEAASKPPVIVQLFKQVWALGLALAPVIVGIGRTLWRLLQLLASWVWKGWKFLLPRIRSVLPEGWNKLPDWTITTVAVLLLALVLWITTLLLPSKAPAQLGDRPPAVSAPNVPQPEPTPDPALITKIQEQVASVTDEYTEGLIQSVQANFGDRQLTVKIGDGWYDLSSTRQDSLANDILKRARRLDFEALQLADGEGERLARSPVVGDKMVIYRRVRSQESGQPIGG
ncbi:hypothetical protein [Egbenema bharatensis]|uniref:hypothetical protein n=1 Tax=Egbenema bharatensis TaxID=3463334 RepID=UPI003A837B02